MSKMRESRGRGFASRLGAMSTESVARRARFVSAFLLGACLAGTQAAAGSTPADATAQQVQVLGQAVVTTAAPIFVLPDASRQPLRVVKEGTILEILGTQGDWLQVEFQDPEWGQRRGYIEARFTKQVAPRPPPLEPVVPEGPPTPTARPVTQAPGRPASSPMPVSTQAFLEVGATTFTAKESFRAVLGDETGLMYGGGVQMTLTRGLKGLFFGVSMERFREQGERVFLFNDEVFKLGITDTVVVTPVLVTVGYKAGPFARVAPYGGGGVGSYQLRETSAFADPAEEEDIEERYVGYHALAGVEVRVWQWIGAAVEGRWSTVPDSLGLGGVSKEFGEDDLGGFGFRFKLLFGY